MMFRTTPIAAAAALLSASLLSGLAQAQTAPAAPAAPRNEARDAAASPETVIVTATRRNEAASKIPFNITAITEEVLREENITDIKKLIAQSPAISAPENPARFADSVTVRGLNVSPVNANNLEYFARSTLAYYLDDTALPNIGLRIKDIARVETLLGPQGTLYGAGSLGGTVRYITHKPRLDKTEGKINTSFWQVKNGGLSNDTDAMLNLPLGKTLALRASVARLDEKGWIDRLSNPPWRTGADAWTTQPTPGKSVYADDNWQKVDTARVALLWQITPVLKLQLSHASQDQLANGTGGASRLPLGVANGRTAAERDAAWKDPNLTLATLPCAPNCAYQSEAATPFAVNDHTILSRYPEFADRRFKMNTVDLDWDLGFAALHSSTSQYTDARVGQGDYASQGWSFYAPEGPILAGYDLGGSVTSDRSANVTFNNAYKGLSHETRLMSKGDGRWDWIAGFFHARDKRNLRFSEVLPGMDNYINAPGGVGKVTASPLPDQGYSEDLGSDYRETALFGELGLRITPQWRVGAGARLFKYEDTATVNIVDWAGGAVDRQYTATGGESGKAYYKLNTSYQWTPELLTYATFSQGYRRGGSNPFRDRTAPRIVADDAKEYQPDSTDNIEIGAKGYLFERRLYIETGLYQINWNNTQTYRSQDVSGFPVNGTANGPDAVSRGWEFSARWKLSNAWQLSYSGATTEAKWAATKTHCIYTNATECRTWAEGGLLGGAPKWKHNLNARFQHTFDNDLYLSATLGARHVGAMQSGRSDSPADNATTSRLPANTRYNASVNLAGDKWSVQLWLSNLTDERALVSTQAAGIMGPRDIYAQPRTMGVNASYAF